MLTVEERIRIVILMAKLESVTSVERHLKKEGVMNIPAHKSMRSIFTKFLETGSVLDAPRSGRPSIEEEKVEEISNLFDENPSTSLRQAAAITETPVNTLRKTLREQLEMKPFKISFCHQLFADDKSARVTMCNEFQHRIATDHNFITRLCFSDEATFHMSGRVNKHNCVVWGTQNPHAIQEVPIKSPGITVWCAMFCDEIIGPYFFESTVTSKTYKAMLQDYFIPQLKRRRKFSTTIFQQDGAPPHWSLEVRALLNKNFPGRWIGRDGPFRWAPRSPDLSSLDFYLWGFLKDRVYGRRPTSLRQLRTFIEEEVAAISRDNLSSSFQNFERRLQLCLREEGGHFEQYL